MQYSLQIYGVLFPQSLHLFCLFIVCPILCIFCLIRLIIIIFIFIIYYFIFHSFILLKSLLTNFLYFSNIYFIILSLNCNVVVSFPYLISHIIFELIIPTSKQNNNTFLYNFFIVLWIVHIPRYLSKTSKPLFLRLYIFLISSDNIYKINPNKIAFLSWYFCISTLSLYALL